MDEARKGQIAMLIITDQLRRRGVIRGETILHEIDDEIIARLKIPTEEILEFTQAIIRGAMEGQNTT